MSIDEQMIDLGDEQIGPWELMRQLTERTRSDEGGNDFDQLVHWAKESGEEIPHDFGALRLQVAMALRNTTSCPAWARDELEGGLRPVAHKLSFADQMLRGCVHDYEQLAKNNPRQAQQYAASARDLSDVATWLRFLADKTKEET